jgi:uncharacterized phage protein gp47/JayE
MPFAPKSVSELNQRAFDYVLRNTDGKISLLTPGSTARALIETNNQTIDELNQSLSLYQAMAYLSTATGVYLDLIGELLGLTRRQARAATIASEDRAIRFYVPNGLLRDFLPHPSDLTLGLIPSGTTVSSADGSVVYIVDSDVTFPRAATEVFVPATASITGTSVNVGSFTLRRHSLGTTSVLVTNPVSITTGRDTESDEEFRARIRARVRTTEGANETAVRLAVLSAPGIADVRLIPYKRGAGSFDALLIPIGNRITKEALEIAARNVSQVVAFGIHWRLREPKYVRVSMIISLSYAGILAGEQAAVRNNVERIVLRHLGQIKIGGELVLNQLGSDILELEPRVKDYTIESLCINGRPQVLHNYSLNSDELFLSDEGLTDPIRVI